MAIATVIIGVIAALLDLSAWQLIGWQLGFAVPYEMVMAIRAYQAYRRERDLAPF